MTGQPTERGTEAARLCEVAPMVQRFCVARLGPVDGADAAQEVLEAVWRAQQRPDFVVGSVFGYAAATARYRVMGSYAERARAEIPSGELADLIWADPGPGPAEQVERAEAAAEASRQVAGLLDVLPTREREVLLASGLGSRPTAETAAELGLTPSGVRSAQVRAMARMRDAVGVRSRNPLASPVPERDRTRRAAADRGVDRGGSARGPGGAPLSPEVHTAGRTAAAAGGSARELAAEFGVSESTAGRWRAATRDRDAVGDPLERARMAVRALPTPQQTRDQLDQAPAEHDMSHGDEDAVEYGDGREASAA